MMRFIIVLCCLAILLLSNISIQAQSGLSDTELVLLETVNNAMSDVIASETVHVEVVHTVANTNQISDGTFSSTTTFLITQTMSIDGIMTEEGAFAASTRLIEHRFESQLSPELSTDIIG